METKYKETEIGLIPEDWEIIALKNFTEKIGSGATPRGGSQVYVENGISFIRSQNVRDEGFKNDLVYINDNAAEKLNNVELMQNDVLLNITGDSICRTSVVPDEVLPGRVNQHVAIIRTNENLYYKFLFFYLCSDIAKWRLLSYDAGGTRKAITKGTLESFTIPLPKYEEQKLIGDFLDSFNKKIHFNHQMNQTLEAIGQAIFRHWFVHYEFPNEEGQPYKSSGGEMIDSELGEIPVGWKFSKIGDSPIEIIDGDRSPNYPKKRELLDEGDYPFLSTKNIKNNHINFSETSFVSKKKFDSMTKGKVENNDIVMTTRGSVGNVALFENLKFKSAIINAQMLIFRSKESFSSYYLFYQFTSKNLQNQFSGFSSGSAQPQLPIKHLEDIKILNPPENIIKKFDLIISKLHKQMVMNDQSSNSLSDIRDSLLPKLMSGKIRVNLLRRPPQDDEPQ